MGAPPYQMGGAKWEKREFFVVYPHRSVERYLPDGRARSYKRDRISERNWMRDLSGVRSSVFTGGRGGFIFKYAVLPRGVRSVELGCVFIARAAGERSRNHFDL